MPGAAFLRAFCWVLLIDVAVNYLVYNIAPTLDLPPVYDVVVNFVHQCRTGLIALANLFLALWAWVVWQHSGSRLAAAVAVDAGLMTLYVVVAAVEIYVLDTFLPPGDVEQLLLSLAFVFQWGAPVVILRRYGLGAKAAWVVGLFVTMSELNSTLLLRDLIRAQGSVFAESWFHTMMALKVIVCATLLRSTREPAPKAT